MAQARIDYDDNELDIINEFNATLHAHAAEHGKETCVQFVDDNEEHDGFIILNTEERPVSEEPVSI